MNFRTLIFRNLRFHRRSHAGVLMGAAISSGALIGALVVGDSVRETLRETALERLGNTQLVLNANDRLFKDDLASRLRAKLNSSSPDNTTYNTTYDFATLLVEPASAVRPDAQARANRVRMYGVDEHFASFSGIPGIYTNLAVDEVLVNEALRRQLHLQPGDTVIFRAPKVSTLSRDAVISPKSDQAVAIRLKVRGFVPASALGNLNLAASQAPPLNAFLQLRSLQRFLNATNEANLLLVGKTGPASEDSSLNGLRRSLQESWELSDLQLALIPLASTRNVEVRTRRVFLDNTIQSGLTGAKAFTNAQPLLTYLVTLLGLGTNITPYSMVTAAGPPYTPSELKDDEIIINQWLADDLGAKPGDPIRLAYFDPESGSRLLERTNFFRVRSIVPMSLPWADRTLLPDFPGIEKAESTHDWDAGFPLVYKILPKDEDYWKRYRGTPKAFVSLAAGQRMWKNRFGSLTAIRFPVPEVNSTQTNLEPYRAELQTELHARVNPERAGLVFEAARSRALAAADQAQDFGQLFLGFSIFLVVAALLLMAVLFQFGLEQRVVEVGTFLALGFTPRRLRWLLLVEASVLAIAGAMVGLFGGVLYAKAMLLGLRTVWRDAIAEAPINFHASIPILVIGAFSSVAVALFTIWLTLRKQARQPAHQLLTGEITSGTSRFSRRNISKWGAIACCFAALAMLVWSFSAQAGMNVEVFFGAGSLLLLAGLAFLATWLARLEETQSSQLLSLAGLGVRTCARRRKRSIATAALLASGCFLIVSIGAFRLDANRDATRRSSGTAGFALMGESTLPILQDLNTPAGRDTLGLNVEDLNGVSTVPFRVRDGDEASCLNLNRAQQPRLLGVNPGLLKGRFTFVSLEKPIQSGAEWEALRSDAAVAPGSDEVAAIGDANSIQWALGKKIGDLIDYTDEQGRKFKLRLVGAVANSILQGSLIIDEAEFLRRFPSESGYRAFLIDTPATSMTSVSSIMTRALQDYGLELSPATQRLNAFNAVQNTYLQTFQILGGLGLLLGSAGLGVVVLRNVLERRAELGLMVAVGYRRATLLKMLLFEHGGLLILGLGIGVVAALVAVLPALLAPGRQLPYFSLSITLIAVLLNGAFWTWLAARFALRGDLLAALKNE